MIEVLWHGRGGQGAFTGARLLGAAYCQREGHHALAFPTFGPERRGAPMRAFTKLSAEKIGDRSALETADIVVYLDDTLFSADACAAQLRDGGVAVVNSPRDFALPQVLSFDANGISGELLGRAIPNTALLGALIAVMPGTLIALCPDPSAHCNAVMRPFALVMGIAIALTGGIDLTWRLLALRKR